MTQELWDLYDGAEIGLPERRDPSYTAIDRWANEPHETDEVDLDDPGLTPLRRAYYGLVTYVDRKLGELLAALEQTGQAGDTVVVFTSDHGDMLDLAPTVLELAGADRPLDGQSLLDDRKRTVFSEYNVEKVRAPCFIARKGCHKLIHVHGHDERLFDLGADPGEWTDLIGRPEVRAVEDEPRAAILERFDPAWIAADGAASVARRELIARAMQRNGTRWDYAPFFDATRQYAR